jgi:hypothetical protein
LKNRAGQLPIRLNPAQSNQKEKVMSKNLLAKVTTSIGAKKNKVWEALVTPDAIKQYMFGADVESDLSRAMVIFHFSRGGAKVICHPRGQGYLPV